MSVSVKWYDEAHTIICYTFGERWTWEEYYPAYSETIQMMDSVSHKVDFIMDMLTSKGLPPGALQQIKRAADRNHPNMGLAVYVGMNFITQALGELFLKIYPMSAQKYPFAFAPTIAEAEQKIMKRREAVQ